jgi:two-component system CheB/CheR fusion protein
MAKAVRSKKSTARGTDRARSRVVSPALAAEPGHRRALSESEADTAVAAASAASADSEHHASQPFPVVGIGASAGGLEALTHFLEKMPGAAGMALVVVQHLDPSHPSILTELLAKSTAMPVIQVTEGVRVEPNHVYVIPPNKTMEIERGALKLTPRAPNDAGHRPIDTFFFSLAVEQKNRAIGVILSGTASDGTLGLQAIKEQGGITFAQDRESAKFKGMPAAAIAAGAVDFVMPPAGIAAELVQMARHPYVARGQGRDEAESDSGEFTEERLATLFSLVRAASGVDFTHYKHSTIRRRILRRMMLNRTENVHNYVELLRRSPAEVTALFNDILINVTDFFRDPEVFEALKLTVLPQLIKGRASGGLPLRIWVPGCASGEEAYSIGICLLEIFETTGHHAPVQIFATDISESALERARAGIYQETSMAGISAERRRRYFVKMDGGYQVAKIVRDMCMFARQDISKDPPFSRIDLISCRNVLIYLGSALQKRVIPAFHYALKSDGFLLLGSSESIGAYAELFNIVDKPHKIYRKLPGVAHLQFHPADAMPTTRDIAHAPAGAASVDASIEREADRVLLGRYSPPGVLIDESMTILQFRGQTGGYLEPAAGTASLNLMRMVRADLQLTLRKVIGEALSRGAQAQIKGQRLRVAGSMRSISIEVVPVSGVPVDRGRYFVVLFVEGKSPGDRAEPQEDREPPRKGDRTRERDEVTKLRQELVSMRDYLQSVIEGQEAANEELRSANEEAQSSNEELQSINEELETAKEELQSTNEELTTINEELENVNQELTQANSDLRNVLDGVEVAIVMLGADLRIRRFTPPAAALLNLISSDVGRPLADLKPNIEVPELGQWIASVADTLIPVRRVVRDGAGHEYDIRIKPYRTADNKIDGAVLTIFERGGGKEAS